MAVIVRNKIEHGLFRPGYFDIIEFSQIDIVLKERNIDAGSCSTPSCIKKIGRLTGTDYIVMGSVDRVGDRFFINVKVVDIKTNRVVLTDSVGTEDAGYILEAADELSGRVARKIERLGITSWKEILTVKLSAGYSYLLPAGYFATTASAGNGVFLDCRIENLFIENYFLGVRLQFHYVTGRDRVHHSIIIPFMAETGYAFSAWKLHITPLISIGGSYNMNYIYRDIFRLGYSPRTGALPVLQAGLILEIPVLNRFDLHIGSRYGVIFESDGPVSYVLFNAGFGFRF